MIGRSTAPRRALVAPFVGVLVLAAAAPSARAHDGPPYPLLVDKVAGPFRLSAWADPDVGVGTFFIYVEPVGVGKLPDDSRVEIAVQPVDRRIPVASYAAVPQKPRRGARRFDCRVPFDTAEKWRVGFRLSSPAGSGTAETEVVVTPPGQGPVLDFVLYLFPFAAVGFLFVRATWKRRDPGARASRTH